jgi:hypothetical protein
MTGKHLKKEEIRKSSAQNARPKMIATTAADPARLNQTTTSLPPEAVADPLLRKSLQKYGNLSPLQQAKLNVVDCCARIESNRKSAAAFRKAASDPKCPEADAQKFRHEADILGVESFGLGFEQRQALSDVRVAAQVHADELDCMKTAEAVTAKKDKRKYTSWSNIDQRAVANLWNWWRENGDTLRTIDCFRNAKKNNKLPQCISSPADFRDCLEAARKNGLTRQVKKERRKDAGKPCQ